MRPHRGTQKPSAFLPITHCRDGDTPRTRARADTATPLWWVARLWPPAWDRSGSPSRKVCRCAWRWISKPVPNRRLPSTRPRVTNTTTSSHRCKISGGRPSPAAGGQRRRFCFESHSAEWPAIFPSGPEGENRAVQDDPFAPQDDPFDPQADKAAGTRPAGSVSYTGKRRSHERRSRGARRT